jgi:acetyltransferase-like isoleucine patch superfamily enzyme
MIGIIREFIRWIRIIKSCDKYRYLRKGTNLIIGPNSYLYPTKHIIIGNNVFIGRNVTISTSSSGRSPISLGHDIMLAERVMIIGGNHDFSRVDIPINKQGEGKQGAILLEDDVWVGAGSIILSGVTIGKGTVIGAGSVVSKSIPEYSIAVGNPAKVIKSRCI